MFNLAKTWICVNIKQIPFLYGTSESSCPSNVLTFLLLCRTNALIFHCSVSTCSYTWTFKFIKNFLMNVLMSRSWLWANMHVYQHRIHFSIEGTAFSWDGVNEQRFSCKCEADFASENQSKRAKHKNQVFLRLEMWKVVLEVNGCAPLCVCMEGVGRNKNRCYRGIKIHPLILSFWN